MRAAIFLLLVALGCGDDGGEMIPPGRELSMEAETDPLILASTIEPIVRIDGFWLFGDQVSRDGGGSWEAIGLEGVTAARPIDEDAVVLEGATGLGLLAVTGGTFFDWPLPAGVELGRWDASPGAGVFMADAEGRDIYTREDGAWVVWAPIEWLPAQLSNRVRALVLHGEDLVVAWDDRAARYPLSGGAPIALPLPPSSTAVDEWYSVGGELIAFTNGSVHRLDGESWVTLEGFFGRDGVIPCPDGSFLDRDTADWRPSATEEWQSIEWLDPSFAGRVVVCDELGSLFDSGTGTLLSRAPGSDRWLFDVPFPGGFGDRDYDAPRRVGERWIMSGFRLGYRWENDGWEPNPQGPFVVLPDGMLHDLSLTLESSDGRTWTETERSMPGSLVAELADGSWIAQGRESIAGAMATTQRAFIHRSTDEGQSWDLIHESEVVCGPGGCRGELHAFELATPTGELVGPEFSSVDGEAWVAHTPWAMAEGWPSYPTVAGLNQDGDLVVLAGPGGPTGSSFDAHLYRDAGGGGLRGTIRVVLGESSHVSTFRLDFADHLIGWEGGNVRTLVRSTEPLR